MFTATLLCPLAFAFAPLTFPDDGEAIAIATQPRVAVVGASVSAGFKLSDFIGRIDDPRAFAEEQIGRELTDAEFESRIDSVPPAELLAAAYGREVATHADLYLFSRPVPKARKVLEAALADGPSLVIGVDLVFWFGYGSLRGVETGTPAERTTRLAQQAEGLAMLDELLARHADVTFVVGDYPDLTGALPLMITPDMIPSTEVRAELNRQLSKWSMGSPRVHVFPLGACLERLRAGGTTLTEDGEERVIDADAAFQLARVHPTRVGVALLVRDLIAWLNENVAVELRPR